MPNENERKWVVNEALNEIIPETGGSHIVQSYLSVSENEEVRLRRREYPGGKVQLTICVKRGKGQNREEVATPIMSRHFNQLRKAAVGEVRKTRYEIPFSSWTIKEWNEKIMELDVYEGDLEGLVIAEIENPPSGVDQEIPNKWKEVTRDERYKNKWLATEGRPE